jgi:hypothetical protein
MNVTADDERELRELEDFIHEAFLEGDGASLEGVLAEGFISTGPDGTTSTKADYIAENTRDLAIASIVSEDLQVRVSATRR